MCSLAALDKEETAERSYKWAIKIDKRFADAYYNYGNFLLGKGGSNGHEGNDFCST